MENIKQIFREHNNEFTIYVVELKFVIGRGLEYFKSYKGKSNYIDTDALAKKRIYKIHNWIERKIPPVAELIKVGFDGFSPMGLVDIVVALNKLFGSQKHQAVGPEVIDPIIIQEGKVLKNYINQLINLHKDSFLAPTIIILLKDNDFERAKELMSDCPNGTNIKFVRNNGQDEIYKVINTGAENITQFISSFAEQSFSTCSKTKHDILLNKEWASNSIVRLYAPRLLKYRANLLCDEKNDIRNHLNNCIFELENQQLLLENDDLLRKNFLCIAKLYRVFCNDDGGSDINDAFTLAKDLNNELLLAYVYKYAFFQKNISIKEQNQQLQQAYEIFENNNMYDNALYCKNNILVRQFDYGSIHSSAFVNMLGEAISDVPGLVGMSHIYNNTGLSFMMTANPDRAIELFDKGLEYSNSSERQVQYFALLCNKLITQSYYLEKIEYSTIQRIFTQIMDGMVYNAQLPFISARYIMNLLIIAIRQDKTWGQELLSQYNLINLFNDGLKSNLLGSGQLLKQLDYIDQKLPECKIKQNIKIPKKVIETTGRRKEFIENSGLNPFYFFTWL